MLRHPLLLKFWGVGIAALGLWHIVSWWQNAVPNREGFNLAVGVFCLLIGVIVLALNFKRKDN